MENIVLPSEQFCIVYDKLTLPMAKSLYNRVKEKGYTCVTWSEAQYKNQEPSLENCETANKMLFLSRKLVKENFSSPHIKPIVTGEWGLIYHEGINAGIGIELGASYQNNLSNDKFIIWSAKQKKPVKRLLTIPRITWGIIKTADIATDPVERRSFKEKVYWNAIEVFYEHYLDDFMAGKELMVKEGVTVAYDEWSDDIDKKIFGD